ncbi:MAG TPA: phosphotransferase [Methylomirabilota bacterium]|nr:phosphotransferase [Methylomirabilota bacterium]
MHRFPTPDQVTDPAAIAAWLGPVRAVEREPLTTAGFSGARFERLVVTLASGEQRRYVAKRFRPREDWTAVRSGDIDGRASAMLSEPRLAGIWDAFACPYVGFACDGGEVALLMVDLTPHLFPDVREPLREQEEARVLGALASLHARFWESPALELAWLARAEHHAGLLDARCAADPVCSAVFTDTLREMGTRGWAAALRLLPRSLDGLIRSPVHELSWLWRELPRTLVHGDAKVANFALLPDGRVAAFDWALLGAGPATLDIGWYVAINASRLTGTKEETLRRYRALLEAARGVALDEACWDRLVRAGIVIAARMLLWSKALAVEAGRTGAQAEWTWWVERLEAVSAGAR